MLSTVFSVVFTVMNTLLASMVNDNQRENYLFTILIFIGTIITMVVHDFSLEDMNHHTIQALIIALIFSCILGPSFVYFSKAIIQETMSEARLSYIERDSYKQLFDAL